MTAFESIHIMQFLVIEMQQINDQVQLFIGFDGAVTEHGADIDHAESTHFQKIL